MLLIWFYENLFFIKDYCLIRYYLIEGWLYSLSIFMMSILIRSVSMFKFSSASIIYHKNLLPDKFIGAGTLILDFEVEA